jgi:hypothetical protein
MDQEMFTTPTLETSDFSHPATDIQIERTVQALSLNNIHAVVVKNGIEAKKKLLEMIPHGAEVFTANSTTLDTLGINEEINKSGRYNSVRAKLALMDRVTQNREMQKLGATPEYMVGSVHAVTETGIILVASMTGSQLAGYAAGAAHMIWVVGTQKIVPTLADGHRRIEEYSLPLEDARAFKATGVHSGINKLLIINKEYTPDRITMIFVKENVGF